MNKARSADKNAGRNKTAPKKTKPAGLLRKKTGSKSKSNRLVCRYCGSADLAPSFIKRRDRRCRKCFSGRYGRRHGPGRRRSGSRFAQVDDRGWARKKHGPFVFFRKAVLNLNIWHSDLKRTQKATPTYV